MLPLVISIFLTYIVPFLIGILSSVAFWYWMSYHVVPEVKFYDKIKHYWSGDEEWNFVKIESVRSRKIFDVEVLAEIKVWFPDEKNPKKKLYNSITLPLGDNHEQVFRIPIMAHGDDRWIRLRFDEVGEIKRPAFPPSIREKSRNGQLTLKDILNLPSNSKARE